VLSTTLVVENVGAEVRKKHRRERPARTLGKSRILRPVSSLALLAAVALSTESRSEWLEKESLVWVDYRYSEVHPHVGGETMTTRERETV
jgi:hypothetical protein